MKQTGHEAVREFRKKKGWSLREMQAETGVSFAQLGYIERGQKPITFRVAKKLAPVMRRSARFLCEE